MKCKKCGRPVSRHMQGECLACRYKKMKFKARTRRICACCFKTFVPSVRSHGQLYCSEECRRTAMKQRQREDYWKSRIVLICPVCGKTFSSPIQNQRTYCSNKCYKAAAKRRKKEQTEMRRCARCGKLFKTKKYYGTQYCSDACRYPTHRGRHGMYEHQEKPEQIKRGQYMKGIIPKVGLWNSPIPQKEDKPAPKCRLKCDPAKLPKPLLPPTRQYTGPDPEAVAYERLLKEATKHSFQSREQDGLAQ